MTLKELVMAVSNDLGLGLGLGYSSSFQDEADIKRHLNQGQRELAKRVLAIKEDYFLTFHDVDLSTGGKLSEFSLPAGIYSNKIRRVTFTGADGGFGVLEKVDFDTYIGNQKVNSTTGIVPIGHFLMDVPHGTTRGTLGDIKLSLVPSVEYPSLQILRVFYLRAVNDMVEDADTPDIVGSDDYLIEYSKWKVVQVDPTRRTDLFFESFKRVEDSFLNSYYDRTPKEGGEEFVLDEGVYSRSVGLSENL